MLFHTDLWEECIEIFGLFIEMFRAHAVATVLLLPAQLIFVSTQINIKERDVQYFLHLCGRIMFKTES